MPQNSPFEGGRGMYEFRKKKYLFCCFTKKQIQPYFFLSDNEDNKKYFIVLDKKDTFFKIKVYFCICG